MIDKCSAIEDSIGLNKFAVGAFDKRLCVGVDMLYIEDTIIIEVTISINKLGILTDKLCDGRDVIIEYIRDVGDSRGNVYDADGSIVEAEIRCII